MKNLFLLVLLFAFSAFADTNTLTDRASGETITASFFNDIHDALSGTVVPRNSSGAPTTGGGDLGSSTYRWGDIYGAAGNYTGTVTTATGYVAQTGGSIFEGDQTFPVWVKAISTNSFGLKLYANTSTDVASIINHYAAALELGANNTVYQTIASGGGITFGASGGTQTMTFNGQLSQTFPTAGTIATHSVTHSDNTNTGSHASLRAIAGGSSGGDPRTHYIISGVRDWTTGIDNSDSDKYKIASSSALETSTWMEIDLSGVATFPGQLIGKGTATNDSAAAGYIGELFTNNQSSDTTIGGTSGQYFDMCTLTNLTAGDWDVEGAVIYNISTGVATDIEVGLSTTSGNSATGLVNGQSIFWDIGTMSGFTFRTLTLPRIRVSNSSTTTWYQKGYVAYSGTQPKYRCTLTARRVR